MKTFSLDWSSWCLAPLALAWAAVATPYLFTHSVMPLAFALHSGFALICHQRPERSFWIFGAPVAVCARCLGIYLGAAVGLLLCTSRQLAMRLLIAAAAINVLDAATEFAGLHGNWMFVRFALGLALGTAGAMPITARMAEERTGKQSVNCLPAR